MEKTISFHGAINERTGYGVHASRFVEQLSKLMPVTVEGPGDIHISLLDTVTAAHTTIRHPYPSILYNVWESTEQPAEFMAKLSLYDQLWVPSEWQRACSIAQGIPEEFVKVVPEGVDPDTYKPQEPVIISTPGIIPISSNLFHFIHVGQWQPRKSTREICEAFIRAFPNNPDVRLHLSADTLFPSDSYKSTEERLEAYGLSDPRIIPVHYEDRTTYVRRLQSAHCFVSCSRSEGWGLPIIEAMACGIPTIVADYSGSTEYAGNALKVRVLSHKKPVGIYGNWDVPGTWGEPDYDHLIEVMQDVYANYTDEKRKALKESEAIRTKFSWAAAAQKAYDIIKAIPDLPVSNEVNTTPEDNVRAYARKHGYEIQSMQKRSAIFAVDCWPDTPEKLSALTETIEQIHSSGYPVLVNSHYPLPREIMEQADFYIFEKRDIMSGDDKPIYWRKRLDGTTEEKPCTKEYQGVAALNCFRNAIDFCRGRYDWVYQMGSDMEVDLKHWLSLVHASGKPMVCIPYEGVKNGFGGGLWAGKTEILDQVIPRLNSWKQYADMYPDVRFVAERWIYNYVAAHCKIEECVEWIEIETLNRFDNVDRDLFDDEFECHFIDGPYLNICGISNREYEVTYSNPIDGVSYALTQKSSSWSRPDKKYFRDWTITAKLNGQIKFQRHLDLKGKNVLISFGSKALGDTLAWIPYVDEFRKKHDCNIYCSTWWNPILDYPDIKFIVPGDMVTDISASYEIGCYDGQLDRNVADWRLTPLQKVSADILGVDYAPLRAQLKHLSGHKSKPYICFSEFSTMRNKLWNRPGAWQEVIDHLDSLGYDCISVSAEPSELKNVIRHNGESIEQMLTDISGAAFYIGLNAGPSWIAYSLGIPLIMITGVAEPWNDAPNPYRVSVDVCRPGCFNDPSLPIDRGWEWCPRKKDYACTREIMSGMVIDMIKKVEEDLYAVKKGKVRCSRKRKYKGDDAERLPASPGGSSCNAQCRPEA